MAEQVDEPPNIHLQKEIIQAQIGKTMVKGQIWYLIDSAWFKKFKRYVGMDETWKRIGVKHPGPIDNTSLFNEDGSGSIHENLVDELDFVLVPSEAWDLLVKWYGTVDNRTAIPREVIEFGVFVKQCTLEVYLLELRLCKNFDLRSDVRHKFSKGDTIATVEKILRTTFGIEDNQETRLWSYYSSSALDQLTKPDITLQHAGLYDKQFVVIETRHPDGTWRHQPKKTPSETSISSVASAASAASIPSVSSISSTSVCLSQRSSSTSIAGPSNLMSTRYNLYGYSGEGRAGPGLCGLSNLGNTCFMNSVLQCMSNCPPITRYFLNEEHLNELNEENPLGMKGEIAKAFGDLIKVMWSGKHPFTMPHTFKLQVGKFAPQFCGYSQHDAQELLTFLLDGLHEDLNRIKQKPYIPNEDSSGRPDKDVAKEAWENYLKRNDSIIVDFFHGLLKSTVVCPECSKVSITFDPLVYLSLPLPTKKERTLEVLLFHYDPTLKPTAFTVIVQKKGLIRDLVANIGRLSNVPPEHLIVAEISKNHFQTFFSSNDLLEKIEDKELVYIYEMPHQTDTHVVLPVCLWEANRKQVFSHDCLFGDPLLIAAPRKDCTYDLLYQMVIRKLNRYLSMPDDNSSWWFPQTNNISNGECTSPDDELPTECNEESCSDVGEEDNVESYRRRLFSLYLIRDNNDGCSEIIRIHNDGNPLQFPKYMGQSFIALRWSQEARKRFWHDNSPEDTDSDISTRNSFLNLRDCIELYTTCEVLGADDAWFCPSCKDHQLATKKFDLWSLPRILIIHLKRFACNRQRKEKIDTIVDYPIRGLNMSEYVIGMNEPDAVYDLIGVCNHYGGLGGGHYTAFCQNQIDHKWYLFDDNIVSETNEQAVVSSAAYVLFYMRRNSYEQMELN